MTDASPSFSSPFAELERRHGIPADTYCGLSPADMSRAIVAYHAGPQTPDEPVGYCPVGSATTRLGWLRGEFGPDADVDRIRVQEQFFGSRVSRALKLDWTLPTEAFARAVAEGLRVHFPELTAEARAVIAGAYAYSHAK